MNALYMVLHLLAALCFLAAAFLPSVPVRAEPTAPPPRPPIYTRVNLVALGLFIWVVVSVIENARDL